MISQRCISIESASEWKQALNGIEHAFAHTWENCYAMQLTTGFKTYLYCFESDDVRIVCPMSERVYEDYTDIVTPYGFSGFVGNGDYPEFSHHWTSFVKQRGYVCGYIALNPLFENDSYFDLNEKYQSNSLYVLDLTKSPDEIFANLDRNRKRQLKHWERDASNLILDKGMLIDFLLTNYYEFIRRVNASQACYFSKETLSFICNLNNIHIVGVGRSDKVESVYVFAYTPYGGDCLFNVSLLEGRHHATILLWYGLSHLKSIGIPFLNLGGSVRENDSVAKSKQRFGSRRLPFRCLKQIYEPEVYAQLCTQAGLDSTENTIYFPSYRRPEHRWA